MQVGTVATGAGFVLAATPAAIVRINHVAPGRFDTFLAACRQSITGRQSGPVGYGLAILFVGTVCHVGVDRYQEGLDNVDC